MSRFVACTDSADLADLLRYAGGPNLTLLPLGPLPASAAVLATLVAPDPLPAVVVLDADPDTEAALRLATGITTEWPATAVVLASSDAERLALAALRAGARDVVWSDADPSELRLVLERARTAGAPSAPAAAQTTGQPMSSGRHGRVISVVSPKGGVGKTTVSTNLAVGLAQVAPQSTVLVDLDVQFGDVASALDLAPEHSLTDAVHGPARHDSMVLKTYLTRHETGLYVICGPQTPAEADAVSGAEVSELLATLAAEFRFVVVDTAPGLSEHTLAAMDATTDLILLTSMDVPGVRGLRKELDTLADLDLATDSRLVVLNFADRRGGLSLADVEATIATSVDLALPRSTAVALSVNQGTPLLQTGQRDPMTKQLELLVARFAPVRPTARSRWGRRPRAVPRRALSRHGSAKVAV